MYDCTSGTKLLRQSWAGTNAEGTALASSQELNVDSTRSVLLPLVWPFVAACLNSSLPTHVRIVRKHFPLLFTQCSTVCKYDSNNRTAHCWGICVLVFLLETHVSLSSQLGNTLLICHSTRKHKMWRAKFEPQSQHPQWKLRPSLHATVKTHKLAAEMYMGVPSPLHLCRCIAHQLICLNLSSFALKLDSKSIKRIQNTWYYYDFAAPPCVMISMPAILHPASPPFVQSLITVLRQ